MSKLNNLLRNEKEEERPNANFTKRKAYKNLIVVGIVFLFIFSAFISLQNLQSSIHTDPNLGVVSLAVIYTSSSLSCLFVPPLMINKFGYKYTIVISSIGYIIYTAANLYPRWWTLMLASVIIGTCSAPLWASEASYLTTIAMNCASGSRQKTNDALITKFFAIFYMMLNLSQIVGNTISSVVLKPSQVKLNVTNESFTCGSHFCPSTVISPVHHDTKQSTVVHLMVIYLTSVVMGTLIAIFFLDKVMFKRKKQEVKSTEYLMAVCKSLKDWKMMLLLPISMFSGLEMGFVFGDYTKSYVTCSLGIEKVGFIMISFGVSNAVTSLAIGLLSQCLNRIFVMLFNAIAQVGLIIWLLIWQSNGSNILIFFAVAALWGMVDAIWRTQVIALFVILYPLNKEVAFSIFKLFQSMGFVVSFSYGNSICISLKLYILLAVLVCGMILYGAVEYKENKILQTELCDQEVQLT